MRERCSFECDGLRTSHLSASLEPCERGVKPAVMSHLSVSLEPCERGVKLVVTSHLSAYLEPCEIV